MTGMSPLFMADFYKYSHKRAYPVNITQIWSNWTPRKSRVPGVNQITWFGLQYLIKKYLIEEFNNNFFNSPLDWVIEDYREVISKTLGDPDPETSHIEELHNLGYLPLKVYALPEGSSVDIGVPTMVVTNTRPEAFWLPNFLETLLSNILWKPSTSATTAREYRKICMKYARQARETDFGFVDYQCHDFSMRGMSGLEDAILSGMGHLLSFNGTDTLPAILAAEEYYGAELAPASCAATEHSVMSAGGKEDELETFRRLIEDIYPKGILSIVSDTWDLWKVLTEYMPTLRDKINARDGKIVVRPDSGVPENILCGDPAAPFGSLARMGVLRLLDMHFASLDRPGKLALLEKVGAIYGDSITLQRADTILNRTVNELEMSPYNVVMGVGSFTYELVTRDTYGWAMKATACRRNGEIIPIWKDPVTDEGFKKSLKGIPAVYDKELGDGYFVVDMSGEEALDNCAYRKVFEDGELLVDEDFETIRQRVRAGL